MKIILMIVLASCSGKGRVKRMYEKEKKEFVKDVQLPSGNKLSVTYMPSILTNQQSRLESKNNMQFHIQLSINKNETWPVNAINEFYQTDSLFSIVYEEDTVWPNYVLPVANGQKFIREYIVSFPLLTANIKSDEFFLQPAGFLYAQGTAEKISFKLSKINNLEN